MDRALYSQLWACTGAKRWQDRQPRAQVSGEDRAQMETQHFARLLPSYLYGLTNDLKYLAAQLGTSERTLRREYLEPKTRVQSEKWFAILPAEQNNILELRWSLRE
jgi:hypothetical protein